MKIRKALISILLVFMAVAIFFVIVFKPYSVNGLYKFKGEALNGSSDMFIFIDGETVTWYDQDTGVVDNEECRLEINNSKYSFHSKKKDSASLPFHVTPNGMTAQIDNEIDPPKDLTKWLSPSEIKKVRAEMNEKF
jgi:hypothetical protein